MEVLCNLYDFPKHLAETERGEKQYREVASEVERNAQVKSLVSQLEEYYDSQQTTQPEEETPPLSPDVERFLQGRRRQAGQLEPPNWTKSRTSVLRFGLAL